MRIRVGLGLVTVALAVSGCSSGVAVRRTAATSQVSPRSPTTTVPAPRAAVCYKGGALRLLATPSTAATGSLVTLSVRPAPKNPNLLEGGNLGSLAAWVGGIWRTIYYVRIDGGARDEPLDIPVKNAPQAFAGVGVPAVPVRVQVPPVHAGTYRFEFGFRALEPGPVEHGNYQLCAAVRVT
jgi:hypothetical protein